MDRPQSTRIRVDAHGVDEKTARRRRRRLSEELSLNLGKPKREIEYLQLVSGCTSNVAHGEHFCAWKPSDPTRVLHQYRRGDSVHHLRC